MSWLIEQPSYELVAADNRIGGQKTIYIERKMDVFSVGVNRLIFRKPSSTFVQSLPLLSLIPTTEELMTSNIKYSFLYVFISDHQRALERIAKYYVNLNLIASDWVYLLVLESSLNG